VLHLRSLTTDTGKLIALYTIKDTLPVIEVNRPMYDPSQKSPEPVVMKQFLPKEGDCQGAEKVLRSCSINL
jgi:hypothetical protein